MSDIHELKSWPEYFAMIMTGDMGFQLRRHDREYKVGDRVELEEYSPQSGTYTGRVLRVEINYVMTDSDSIGAAGLKPGYCIIGIKKV